MKVIKMQIPEYTPSEGIQYNWENGFNIETSVENGVIIIAANKEGLISLANHLMNLAQTEIPLGYHLHFDEYNSLEENSLALVIQKN